MSCNGTQLGVNNQVEIVTLIMLSKLLNTSEQLWQQTGEVAQKTDMIGQIKVHIS